MNIIYISGSRSEYFLMRKTLQELDKNLNLSIVATGMHLSPSFGNTVEEIENDGFEVIKVDMLLQNDTLGSMTKSLGIGMYGITQIIENLKPDLIFVEGDRGESLAGAIIGAHQDIPVIHHGGGDISGSIDNKIRYAITMFSDYHLVSNVKSYQKLVSMGFQKDKIFCVGEPGLDDILQKDFVSKEKIVAKYNITQTKPLIILLQHPNTEEVLSIKKDVSETLDAIVDLKIQTIALYANSDAGGQIINRLIDEYSFKYSFIKSYANIERKEFLGLLNVSDLMVGNSSSGIIELPSLKKPFVNVGSRQNDRIQTENTINVGYNKKEIIKGIKIALFDEKFRKEINNVSNPYGDGKSSHRIVEIILDIMGSS